MGEEYGMQRAVGSLGFCVLLCALPGTVRADDVHIEGGSVVEGKVTRHADKVTIELESGQITLSADAVQRIDKRESSVEHFDRLYSALKPDDVSARMSLANYCRDHDMHAREHTLLSEVIELAPNHADARARLGYVKGDGGGWITRDDQNRARGMVQRDGVWMTSERALELTRREEEAQSARRDHERAQTQLEAERVALRRQQLELDQERANTRPAASNQTPYYLTPGYGYGYGYGYRSTRAERQEFGVSRSAASPQPFESPSVRALRAPSFSAPGGRDNRTFVPTR
jgi:hypothetical protein